MSKSRHIGRQVGMLQHVRSPHVRGVGLTLVAVLSACGPVETGGEGERCAREQRIEDGVTIQVGVCDAGLTCVEYDFECGLGLPIFPCQDEACLDCSDEANQDACTLAEERSSDVSE